MSWPPGRRLVIAALAALLVCLVLAAVLADAGPLGDDHEGGSHARAGARARHAASAPRRGPADARAKRQSAHAPPRQSATASRSAARGEDEPQWSVYLVPLAGGRPNLVAHTPSEVPVTPAWSRRTGLIAFVRPTCEDCDAALWLTGPSGEGRRQVSSRVGNLTDPSWAPSARALAAVKVGAGLYLIGARDGRARPLLPRAVVEDPDWSPTGGAIAFARRRGAAGWDLYTVSPDGSGLRRLTRSRAQELAPDWSPDGRRIAFQRQDPDGAWSIYSIRTDGAGLRRLVHGTVADSAEQPAWGPDGQSLAFVSVTLRGTRVEVATLGSRAAPRALTGPDLQAADPDWSPDGRRLVFSGKRAKG